MARGGLVDEAALVASLESGHLGGAGLDTFAVEPLPPESPLWTLPNVTITPHNSGAVHAHELAPICTRNLRAFTEGRLAEPLVDVSRGY
jgi:D-2-hydroxyacid dehydrogenase (NADP+)